MHCTGQLKLTKGQLISKWFFGFRYPPKNERKIRLYYYDISGRRVFIRFLEVIEDTKRHLEINWPLVIAV